MSPILFVGGGSIGHIAPGVAVWEELSALDPALEAHFVCSPRGEDDRYLTELGLPHTVFDSPRAGISLLWTYPRALRRAHALLAAIAPKVVFGTGGYASLPLCHAAHAKGIPIILHESDAVRGRANGLIGRWAAAITLGFEVAAPTAHMHRTGNPVRKSVRMGSREEGMRITGFAGDRPVLLVMGGSQGAQAINEAIAAVLPALTDTMDVIHLTGRGKTVAPSHPHYWTREFVTTELPHLYALTKVAVSRAGAGGIAELGAHAIPTVLVPLRSVGHDHQRRNVEALEKKGACIALDQKRLSELPNVIRTLLADDAKCTEIGTKMRSTTRPDASLQIAEIISELLAEKGRDN